MYTQSRTKTVPYGFICGFPVQGVSSELYGYYEGQGGKSGRQGEAVVAAMKQWGEGEAGTAGAPSLDSPFASGGIDRLGRMGAGATAASSTTRCDWRTCANRRRGCQTLRGLALSSPGLGRFDQWTFGEKNVVSESSSFLSIDSAEEGDLGRVAVDSPARGESCQLSKSPTAF